MPSLRLIRLISLFAASGAARNTAQISRTNRAVKLESLTLSCQAPIDFRALPTTAARRRWSCVVMGLLDRAKLRLLDFGYDTAFSLSLGLVL